MVSTPPARRRFAPPGRPQAVLPPDVLGHLLHHVQPQLEDIRLHALELIGRAGLTLGGAQLGSVERAARTLIEAEPYRESGYVLLMEALAAEGNLAEGLLVFERLRTLLRDELGTNPSPDALAAHQRLLRPTAGSRGEGAAETVGEGAARGRGEGAARGRGEGAARGTSFELPASLLARATGPIVGRAQELEALGDLWSRAAEGRGSEIVDMGRVVLLAGDPGIGKTRLVAEIARTAHDAGAFVLAGRSPRETLVPYQPFVEALRHYLLNASLGELRASAREYGSELARLVPELRRRAPDLPPPVAGEPDTARYRLFEAVVGLLTEISGIAPVLLVLDDLQWADRPSLLMLRHLARATDPARLLILGTYRVTDSEVDGLADVLSELRRERLVTQIDIVGLPEPDTAELVTLRTEGTPSRAFCSALYEETEGNPFFIEEIVRHLAEAGIDSDHGGAGVLQRVGLPEGVKDVISRRLARLDAQATECLRVAAVIGRDFDVSLLERVVSLDEDEFLGALDEALAAGLVVESPAAPGRYSFSHGLIRETLNESMSAPRRARTHRRVGEALEAAGGDGHLGALAHHFTRAAGSEDAEKAIRYALRAGEQATAVLAHEEAGEIYARALEVLDRFQPDAIERRCELLLLLGEARVREGERPEAWLVFREAASLARGLGDGASLARAAIGASRRYVQPPGVVDAELIALLEEALATGAGERTAIRVELLARLCGSLYHSSVRGRMKSLSAEATAIASELGDLEARAIAAAARRRAYWEPAYLDERLSSATELLTLARDAGNLELSLAGNAWLVVDLLESGDRDAVEAQVEAFATGARRLRQPLYLWNAAVWQAMLALLDGRLDEAETLAGDALAAGARAETVTASQYYSVQLLALRQEQGRMGELEQAAQEFVNAYPTVPAWRAALARLLWEAGETDRVRRELDVLAANQFEDIPRDGNWIAVITLLGELCAGLGDAERAARLYELLLPFRDVNVVIGVGALCQGSAARDLGLLAACTGSRQDACELFEQALEANAALRAPVWLCRTQLDYAATLGPGARAAELVEAAARTAAELGLTAIARRAAKLHAPSRG